MLYAGFELIQNSWIKFGKEQADKWIMEFIRKYSLFEILRNLQK